MNIVMTGVGNMSNTIRERYGKSEISNKLADTIYDLAMEYIKHDDLKQLEALVEGNPELAACIEEPTRQIKEAIIIGDPSELQHVNNIDLHDIRFVISDAYDSIECLNNLPKKAFRCLDYQTALTLFEHEYFDNTSFDECADLDWYKKIAPIYKLKEL